jgi:hypothetical protein
MRRSGRGDRKTVAPAFTFKPSQSDVRAATHIQKKLTDAEKRPFGDCIAVQRDRKNTDAQPVR